MKALVLDAANKAATLCDVPIPQPGPNELLIAVKAIALNPVDAFYTRAQPLGRTGRIIGSDFAGLVVARGPLLASSSSSSAPASRDNDDSGLLDEDYPRSSPTATTTFTTFATTHASSINRGDRVAGFLQGACSVNDRPGAFAEYVVCPADLVWRVPPHMSFAEAASVSLCGLTAAQGVYARLGLDAPFQWDDDSEEGILQRVASHQSQRDRQDANGGAGKAEGRGTGHREEGMAFLVAGASTSVGMYVAQLVRRSAEMTGRRVKLIGLASPRNFEKLKAKPYGYDHLLDYRDPDWPEKVRQASGGGVHYAYDAISEGSTVRNTSSTLRKGGKMAVVRSREAGAWETDGVMAEPLYGAVWEGLGEDVDYDRFVVRSSPEKRAFASGFYKWLSDGGLLQPNPTRIMPGRLDKVVEDGLALLGNAVTGRDASSHGRQEEHMRPISGQKLVYLIETDRTGSAGDGHFN